MEFVNVRMEMEYFEDGTSENKDHVSEKQHEVMPKVELEFVDLSRVKEEPQEKKDHVLEKQHEIMPKVELEFVDLSRVKEEPHEESNEEVVPCFDLYDSHGQSLAEEVNVCRSNNTLLKEQVKIDDEMDIINLHERNEITVEDMKPELFSLNETPVETFEELSQREKIFDLCDLEEDVEDINKVSDIVQLLVGKDTLSASEEKTLIVSAQKTVISLENQIRSCSQVKKCKRWHMCLFCKNRFQNMTSHFMKEHTNMVLVSCLIEYTPDSVQRRQQLILLQRIGDFQHNSQVLLYKCGELRLLWPSEKFRSPKNFEDYLPCPECSGFVHKCQLKRHHRICFVKGPDAQPETKRNLFEESRALLCYSLAQKKQIQLDNKVLDHVRSCFGSVAKKDVLIRLVGHFMMNSKRKDQAKSTMLKMACLLLSFQKLTGDQKVLMHHLLDIKNLGLLMTTVKTWLIFKSSGPERIQSYKCLYRGIISSVFIWRGKLLKEGYVTLAENLLVFYNNFVNVWEQEITNFISSESILHSLDNAPVQIDNALPLTATVIRLTEMLTSRLVSLMNMLKAPVPGENLVSAWYDLAETIISLLCLLNPLDFSKIEDMTVAEYATRPDWSLDSVESYKHLLGFLPYRMATKRFIIIVQNNNNKGESAVLVTRKIKQAIDILITKRTLGHVSPQNPHVFATQHFNTKGTLKAANCFYNQCIKGGSLSGDAMLNGKKRQFISYVTNISEMSPDEILKLKEGLDSSKIKQHKLVKRPVDHALQAVEVNQMLEQQLKSRKSTKEKGTQTEGKHTQALRQIQLITSKAPGQIKLLNPLSQIKVLRPVPPDQVKLLSSQAASKIKLLSPPVLTQTKPPCLTDSIQTKPLGLAGSQQTKTHCPTTSDQTKPLGLAVAQQTETQCPTTSDQTKPQGLSVAQQTETQCPTTSDQTTPPCPTAEDETRLPSPSVPDHTNPPCPSALGNTKPPSLLTLDQAKPPSLTHIKLLNPPSSTLANGFINIQAEKLQVVTAGGINGNKRCTDMEQAAILDFFKEDIINEIVPDKLKCLKCISQKRRILGRRGWRTIKSVVQRKIEQRIDTLREDNPLFWDMY